MNAVSKRFGLIVGIATAAWWIALIINGLLPQLQIFLLGGIIVIPTWFIRALLLLAILLYGFRGRYRLYPASVVPWWTLFVIYLVVEFFVHMMSEERSLGYLVQGTYQYYYFLILIVFCHHLAGSIDDRWMTPLLILSFIPLGALGLAQYILYDPILPVESADGYFQVIAWKHWFYSGIRSFSLFRSATEFGHYSALIGGLLMAVWLRRGHFDPVKSLAVMAVLVLVLASVYVAKGRIAYLVSVATILAAIWISPRLRVSGSMLILPLLFAGFAYFVAIAAPQMVKAMGFRLEGMIFSDDSLDYRWSAWSHFTDAWLGQGWLRALFGSGLVQGQGGEFGSEGSVLIDNAFIAIGFHIGILGLLIWLMVVWKLWQYVLETAIRRQSALSLGVAAYWATLPMSLMFSSAQPLYFVPLLLIFFEREAEHQEAPLDEGEPAGVSAAA